MDINRIPQVGAGAAENLRETEARGRAQAREGEPVAKQFAPIPPPSVPEHQKKNVRLLVHEATNRVIIRITDQVTGDQIVEIPPEKYLDMVAKFLESIDLGGGGVDRFC